MQAHDISTHSDDHYEEALEAVGVIIDTRRGVLRHQSRRIWRFVLASLHWLSTVPIQFRPSPAGRWHSMTVVRSAVRRSTPRAGLGLYAKYPSSLRQSRLTNFRQDELDHAHRALAGFRQLGELGISVRAELMTAGGHIRSCLRSNLGLPIADLLRAALAAICKEDLFSHGGAEAAGAVMP